MSQLSASLHDAEIVGIRSPAGEELLAFDLVLPDKKSAALEFQGAQDWDLEGYRPQNVLFGIYEWGAGSAKTVQVCADWGLSDFWVDRIMAGEFTLFDLNPSVGLAGYVIARAMVMKAL